MWAPRLGHRVSIPVERSSRRGRCPILSCGKSGLAGGPWEVAQLVRVSVMRKQVIGALGLCAAAVLTYGCNRFTHPAHLPDAQGNAAPIRDVATKEHAR